MTDSWSKYEFCSSLNESQHDKSAFTVALQSDLAQRVSVPSQSKLKQRQQWYLQVSIPPRKTAAEHLARSKHFFHSNESFLSWLCTNILLWVSVLCYTELYCRALRQCVCRWRRRTTCRHHVIVLVVSNWGIAPAPAPALLTIISTWQRVAESSSEETTEISVRLTAWPVHIQLQHFTARWTPCRNIWEVQSWYPVCHGAVSTV